LAKKKTDPLNKKAHGAVSAALTVADIPGAASFYRMAVGFTKRAIMNVPDGKPMHAELTLGGTVLMLGPENAAMGKRTVENIGPRRPPRTSMSKTSTKWSTRHQTRRDSPVSGDGHVLG